MFWAGAEYGLRDGAAAPAAGAGPGHRVQFGALAGATVAKLSQKHNLSTTMLYQQCAKYGGMDTSMIK